MTIDKINKETEIKCIKLQLFAKYKFKKRNNNSDTDPFDTYVYISIIVCIDVCKYAVRDWDWAQKRLRIYIMKKKDHTLTLKYTAKYNEIQSKEIISCTICNNTH